MSISTKSSNQVYNRTGQRVVPSFPTLRSPYRYKYELVKWAMKKFSISESKANSYSKSQLYAMWYRGLR